MTIARIVCLRKSLRRDRRLSFSFSPEISEIFEPKNFLFDQSRISLESSIIGKLLLYLLGSRPSRRFSTSSYNFDWMYFRTSRKRDVVAVDADLQHAHIESTRVQWLAQKRNAAILRVIYTHDNVSSARAGDYTKIVIVGFPLCKSRKEDAVDV